MPALPHCLLLLLLLLHSYSVCHLQRAVRLAATGAGLLLSLDCALKLNPSLAQALPAYNRWGDSFMQRTDTTRMCGRNVM